MTSMSKKKVFWLCLLAFTGVGLLVYGAEIAYAFAKDRNKKMEYSFEESPEEAEVDYLNEE